MIQRSRCPLIRNFLQELNWGNYYPTFEHKFNIYSEILESLSIKHNNKFLVGEIKADNLDNLRVDLNCLHLANLFLHDIDRPFANVHRLFLPEVLGDHHISDIGGGLSTLARSGVFSCRKTVCWRSKGRIPIVRYIEVQYNDLIFIPPSTPHPLISSSPLTSC